MKTFKLFAKLSLAAILLLSIVACSPQPSPKDMSVKNSTPELSRFIKFPIQPKSVQWQILTSSQEQGGLGPDDWGIVAVLGFSPEDKQKIIETSNSINVDTTFPSSFILDWFPVGVRSLFAEAGGHGLRLKAAPKDAVLFYNSPLINGFFVPANDDEHLFLYLFTQ